MTKPQIRLELADRINVAKTDLKQKMKLKSFDLTAFCILLSKNKETTNHR